MDEVLQSQTVYSNVSKGVLAKSKDLQAAFGMDDQSKICLEVSEGQFLLHKCTVVVQLFSLVSFIMTSSITGRKICFG